MRNKCRKKKKERKVVGRKRKKMDKRIEGYRKNYAYERKDKMDDDDK